MSGLSPRQIVEQVALLKLAYAMSPGSTNFVGAFNGWNVAAVEAAFAADRNGFSNRASDYRTIVTTNFDLLAVDPPTANAPIGLLAVRDRRTGVMYIVGDGTQLGSGLGVAVRKNKKHPTHA